MLDRSATGTVWKMHAPVMTRTTFPTSILRMLTIYPPVVTVTCDEKCPHCGAKMRPDPVVVIKAVANAVGCEEYFTNNMLKAHIAEDSCLRAALAGMKPKAIGRLFWRMWTKNLEFDGYRIERHPKEEKVGAVWIIHLRL